MMMDAEYFLEKAEQCFRLAKLAKQPGNIAAEIAANLEALGNEFMTRAVEIETVRQKTPRKNLSHNVP
jgi:hypothetical protein